MPTELSVLAVMVCGLLFLNLLLFVWQSYTLRLLRAALHRARAHEVWLWRTAAEEGYPMPPEMERQVHEWIAAGEL